MHTEIWIKTSFIGCHCWPDAPDSVAYLRNMHRHVFGVKVGFRVNHDDRDLEFHIVKGQINDILAGFIISHMQPHEHNTSSMSCEQIAKRIASAYDQCFRKEYIQGVEVSRITFVEVDEDGECGARYTHTTLS